MQAKKSTYTGPVVEIDQMYELGLTNYVVAHSEYSSQLGRRSMYSGVLADDEELEGVDGAANDQDAPVKITTSDDGAPVR